MSVMNHNQHPSHVKSVTLKHPKNMNSKSTIEPLIHRNNFSVMDVTSPRYTTINYRNIFVLLMLLTGSNAINVAT